MKEVMREETSDLASSFGLTKFTWIFDPASLIWWDLSQHAIYCLSLTQSNILNREISLKRKYNNIHMIVSFPSDLNNGLHDKYTQPILRLTWPIRDVQKYEHMIVALDLN